MQLLLAYGLLRELPFPGPPTLGSLVALGGRGILCMGRSRLPRSAAIVTLPRMGPPRFLPEEKQNPIIRAEADSSCSTFNILFPRKYAHLSSVYNLFQLQICDK